MADDRFLWNTWLQRAPFPIAYSLRRLHELGTQDHYGRSTAMFDLVELVVRWMTAVAISGYQAAEYFDRSFNDDLAKTLARPISLGRWVYLLRTAILRFRRAKRPFPLPGLETLLFDARGKPTSAARLIDDLVSLRNRVIHGGFSEGESMERSAAETWELLVRLLLELQPFLLSYYPAFATPRSEHVWDLYTMRGASADFFPEVNPTHLAAIGLSGAATLLMQADSNDVALVLDPYCTVTGEFEFAFLSRLSGTGRSNHGCRVGIRTLVPAVDDWVEDGQLAEKDHIREPSLRALESMLRWTRRVSVQDIGKLIPAVRFPSMLSELVERRELLVGRDDEQFAIREWIEKIGNDSTTESVLYVHGPLGFGKSALLTHIALDTSAVFHFVGRTGDRADLAAIFSSLASQAADRFDLTEFTEVGTADVEDAARLLSTTLELASQRLQDTSRSPLIIVIDNLDDLEHSGRQLVDLFPFPVPPFVGLILSSRKVVQLPAGVEKRLLPLGPLTIADVQDMVCAILAVDSSADTDRMARHLHAITEGNPLLLQMLLRDRWLLERRDQIATPNDVLRLLVSRYDGRADEDDYEQFLALLAIAREPIPVSVLAEVIGTKRRKINGFVRSIEPYLRRTPDGVELIAAQVAEKLQSGDPATGVDPTLLMNTVRAFVEWLRGTVNDRWIRYRRQYLPPYLSMLPNPESHESLGEWMATPDFAAKLGASEAITPPAVDVRLFLQAGGVRDNLVRVLEEFLSGDAPELVAGALRLLKEIPEIQSPALLAKVEELGAAPSEHVREQVDRLRRAYLNHASLASERPRLLVMDLVAHFPLIATYASSDADFALLISESYSDRLRYCRDHRIEFLATTLDEVARLHSDGLRYVPFLRLIHSRGMDAVVVDPKHNAVTLTDLNGVTVGFEAGSVSPIWFRQLLADAGLRPTAVREHPFISLEDCAHALGSGRIDAAILWEPWVTASGGRVIAESGASEQVINDVLCIREDVAADLIGEATCLVRYWDSLTEAVDPAMLSTLDRYFEIDAEMPKSKREASS